MALRVYSNLKCNVFYMETPLHADNITANLDRFDLYVSINSCIRDGNVRYIGYEAVFELIYTMKINSTLFFIDSRMCGFKNVEFLKI